MSRRPGDPLGHYASLDLEPGAGLEQIQQAYWALELRWRKGEGLPRYAIQEAYRFLTDPQQKARYDRTDQEPVEEPPARRRSMVLGGVLVTLFVYAGFFFPGFLLGDPPPFDAGDVLVQATNQVVLGRVVRLEPDHRFPNDVVAPAYLIRIPDGRERWYPAGDLERYFYPQHTGPRKGAPVGAAS